MKSLYAFMYDRQLDLAIRLDTNPPSAQRLNVHTTTGEPVAYNLFFLPLYMTESIPDIQG